MDTRGGQKAILVCWSAAQQTTYMIADQQTTYMITDQRTSASGLLKLSFHYSAVLHFLAYF
jgi:hypothetical protein